MSQNNIGINLNMKTRMARDKTKGLSKSFVQLSKDGKAADTSLIGVTNTLGTMKNVIAGVGLHRLARGLGKAASAASDIRESVHMYNVAMGDFAEVTAEAVDELTTLSGLDPIKTLDSVGEFNLLARSMGVTSENSAVLSENINRLSLDLSSLTNRDILKVQEDFKSGLLGRSRTVYKYGIDITEAALAQEAFNQGITKSVRHMSQSEKMQLRYQIMIRSTALAHGDFAETIETPANQMRIFSDRILTATRSLGTVFIPMLEIVMPYLNAFAKTLNVVFQALARLVGYDPKVNEGIKNTGDTFGDATGQLEDGLDDAGKASDEAGKDVDKLKKKVQQLAGFDELNILGKHETPTKPKESKKDSGLGRGEALEFDLPGYESGIEGIAQKSDELFEKMMSWMEKVREAARPTTNALVRLWNEGLSELSNFSSTALKDFYHNFLVPVGLWTLGEQGLARFVNVVNKMLKDINWNNLNSHLADLFDALAPFAVAVGTGLIDFFELVYAPFVVWTYNDAVPRMLKATTDMLNSVNWDEINLKLRNFFEMLGITRINVYKPLVSFYEKALMPIAGWTIGTGFPKLLDILTDGMKKIKWEKIHKSFDNLWESVAPFGERIGEGLLWLMEKVLVPLATWTISNVLPTFLDVLRIALDHIGNVIDVVAPLFKILWEVLIEPLATLIGLGLQAFGGVLKFFTPVLTGFLMAWGVIKTLGLIGQIMSFTSEVGIFSGVAKTLGKNLSIGGSGGLAGLVDEFAATLLVAGDGVKGMGSMFKGVIDKVFSIPTGLWIVGIGAALLVLKELVEYMREDGIGEVEIFGEGVSDATELALGGFLDLEQEATNVLNEIKYSGMEITEEMSEELTGLYNQMTGSIVTELESQRIESLKVIDGLKDDTLEKHGLMRETIIDIINGTYDDRIEIAQEREERVNEIMEEANKNGGELKKEHRKELFEINEGMKKDAVETMSKNEKEQLIIMDNLKREGSKISAKGASEIIKSSIKRKKETIREADEEYYGQMEFAKMLRKDGSKEAMDLADAVEEEAERQRKRSIEEAERMNKEVVEQARQQAGDHGKYIDEETGDVLTNWQAMVKGVSGFMSELDTFSGRLMEAQSEAIRGWIDGIGESVNNAWSWTYNEFVDLANNIIGAANWILDKFGGKQFGKLKKKNYNGSGGSSKPSYSKYRDGTDGHPGGPAMVNDQVGSTYRELIELPDGRQFIPKRRNVFMPDMPRGTKVLPASLTAKIPHYKDGIGSKLMSTFKGIGSSAWEKLKSGAGTIWDFLKKPGELVMNALQDKVSLKSMRDKSEMSSRVGEGIVGKATSIMTDWVKGLFTKHSYSSSGAMGAVGFPQPPFKGISSRFGYRTHPIFGTSALHTGIDLPAPSGTPVDAQKGGRVTQAGWAGGYGKLVKIAQGNTEQLYAHLSKILTSRNKSVRAGERIGRVGSTGNSTGPHLHYETRKDGVPVNPGNPLVSKAVYDRRKKENQRQQVPTGDKVGRWAATVRQALGMNNLPTTPAYVNAWLRQIKTESGGNPGIVQSSQVKDVNYYSGNLARGLVQVIPPTFRAYSFPGHKDPFNGLDSLLAGMNYAKNRYGKKGMLKAIGQGRGYARGGFITGMTSFNVAGESGKEGIVPLEGRHMIPFADAVADRITEYTQTVVNQNDTGANSGGLVVNVGGRTLVDITASEMKRKSRINGKNIVNV